MIIPMPQSKRFRHPARLSVIAMLLVMLVLIALGGCGTPAREEIFETGGPTTEQVWYGSVRPEALLGDAVGWNPGGPAGAGAWTRTAETELSALFPELPNPRIILYVFPHLTAAGHPVPGYVTNFHLYESSRVYALPGEAFRHGVRR